METRRSVWLHSKNHTHQVSVYPEVRCSFRCNVCLLGVSKTSKKWSTSKNKNRDIIFDVFAPNLFESIKALQRLLGCGRECNRWLIQSDQFCLPVDTHCLLYTSLREMLSDREIARGASCLLASAGLQINFRLPLLKIAV